jgi:hypothetical protein
MLTTNEKRAIDALVALAFNDTKEAEHIVNSAPCPDCFSTDGNHTRSSCNN